MRNINGVVLVVMDGWGLREETQGNAIAAANTPNFDRLWQDYPHAQLKASGEAVGLPEGQMGTSEVNHLTIGAGRIIFQDLVRINKAVQDGSFYGNEVLNKAIQVAKERGTKLHLLGLVSEGGVHSHSAHFKPLIQMAKKAGLEKVFIHAFTDGRDALPRGGKDSLKNLEDFMQEVGVGEIASVSGRYYAMDRDHNWERTDKAYEALVEGNGEVYETVDELIANSYNQNITDEFILPAQVKTKSNHLIEANDVVVFVNFRTDRPRQLVERFGQRGPENLYFVTLTRYKPEYPVKVAFPPEEPKNSLGEVLSRAGIKQMRVTETEKFAHLTFFLNCKKEDAFEREDRMMFDSYSDIPTHDQRPVMRAPDITEEVVEAVNNKTHQVIFTNICNCDMVGHSGNFEAIIQGVEAVDRSIGQIAKAAIENNYEVIITADHGNAEETVDQATGQPLTSHTLNPVPFILVTQRFNQLRKKEGLLIDIAPTILRLLELEKPAEMTGESLV